MSHSHLYKFKTVEIIYGITSQHNGCIVGREDHWMRVSVLFLDLGAAYIDVFSEKLIGPYAAKKTIKNTKRTTY